jgi:hypothetical protein
MSKNVRKEEEGRVKKRNVSNRKKETRKRGKKRSHSLPVQAPDGVIEFDEEVGVDRTKESSRVQEPRYPRVAALFGAVDHLLHARQTGGRIPLLSQTQQLALSPPLGAVALLCSLCCCCCC